MNCQECNKKRLAIVLPPPQHVPPPLPGVTVKEDTSMLLVIALIIAYIIF